DVAPSAADRQRCVAPDFSDRHCSRLNEFGEEARRGDQNILAPKRANISSGVDRLVRTVAKKIGTTSAKLERLPCHKELDASIEPSSQQRVRMHTALQLPENRLAALVIDRPAIVGIDQAEIPQLRPLIEIGNARRH